MANVSTVILIGDKARVIKVNPFQRPWLRKYRGRVGVVTEIREVIPSKRVPDGKIYKLSFDRLLPQTFIRSELKGIDKP